MKSPRILITDVDTTVRPRLARAVAGAGFDPVEVPGAAGAVDALRGGRVDLMLLDVHRPDRSELDVLRQVKRDWPDLPVIVLGGQGTVRCAVEAIRAGAVDYLADPFEAGELVGSVRKALAGGGPRRTTAAGPHRAGRRDPRQCAGESARCCPSCGSAALRPSRVRWYEYLFLLALVRPLRCASCYARFWRPRGADILPNRRGQWA